MLRAIWTPGHTPGHFCFEVCGTGAMLLGDHVLFDIAPNITDWWDVPDSLWRLFKESGQDSRLSGYHAASGTPGGGGIGFSDQPAEGTP